jgi:superkiller protein 3
MPKPESGAQELVYKAGALDDLGQRQDALQLLDKAISIDPELADAWHSKGVALARLGRWEDSLHCTDRALVVLRSPDKESYFVALCLMNKGHALSNLHRRDEAMMAYRRAAETNDDIRSLLESQRLL